MAAFRPIIAEGSPLAGMLESVVVATRLPDSTAAGQALGEEIAAGLHGEVPDALIVFASSRYDYGALLAALDAACRPRILVGCSSAGEFTGAMQAGGAVSALALRVPLGVEETGAGACAADVPAGARVEIMGTTAASAGGAAVQATRAALQQLDGHRPQVALFFDCVATRLRLGQAFEVELATVRHELAEAPFVGCNTYGQIARAEGQFGGFHNCTAVVRVLPA